MTFHYSSWLSFVLYSDLCLPIPTDEEFPSSPAFLLSTENIQDMFIEWINFPPIFSLGVKTHFSKWLPEPWFSTQATPTSSWLQQTHAQFTVSNQFTFFKPAGTRKDASNSISVVFISHLRIKNTKWEFHLQVFPQASHWACLTHVHHL